MTTLAMTARSVEWRESKLFRYGTSIVLSGIAYVAQCALWPYIPPSPQLLFYPAVFLAGRVGGFGPGMLATILSAFGMAHAFLPPHGVFAVDAPEDVLDWAIFVGVGSGMSMLLGRLRVALAREREATRAAQEAKKATDETWEMMAHDLRTPLNVITLSSEQLGRRLQEASPDLERVVGAIQRSTDRARDLVQDAVEAMRLEGGGLTIEPAPRPIGWLVAEAADGVAAIARRKGVSLVVERCDGAVVCDGARMLQVLSNLLVNAIKFTPGGGRVSLEATRRDGKVRFVVADTGPGIPADQIANLFSRYWTRDRGGGFGLGLWIARTIVEAHGETLAVSSVVGQGTKFSFDLPRAGARREALTAPGASRAS